VPGPPPQAGGPGIAEPAVAGCRPPGRCPYCGGRALRRFGRTPRGAQRWHCHGCGRKHQATTRTPLAGLHQPAKFSALVADMLGPRPTSCRGLARALAVDKSTAWQWRQKACRGFTAAQTRQGEARRSEARRGGAPLLEPGAAHVTSLRESRKASREWVNHRRDPDSTPDPTGSAGWTTAARA
jgi:transposase-like protein